MPRRSAVAAFVSMLPRVAMLLLACLLPRLAKASWASDGGAVVSVSQAQTQPTLAPDASGGVFFGWVDARSGFNTDIRAVRWNVSGATVAGWTSGGDALTLVTCQKYDPAMIADGAGGAVLTWSDDRCTGFRQVYARRVAAGGVAAAGWPANGVRLAATSTGQFTPAIASDGAGGAFVAWQDLRGVDPDIFVQHVDGAGAIVAGWPAAGLDVSAVVGVQSAPALAADGTGGVFVAWQDRRAGNDDIVLQHVTAAGTLVGGWVANGLLACNAAGDQRAPSMDSDEAGGVVLAWQDQRVGNWDVYATRVQGGGSLALGWNTNGNAMCTAIGDQTTVRVVRDGGNGVIAAWQDHRGLTWDVYAQRLTGAGTLPAGWSADGSALATASDDQTAPTLAPDGASGAYVVWLDRRAGNADIEASRIAADGSTPTGWTAGGTLLCGATGDQTAPQITAALGGGAFVIWGDPRNVASGLDLYAHHLLADGPEQVRPTGLAANHHDGQTFLTWNPPAGTGWTHRIYFSASAIAVDADLNSATLLGSVGDSSATDARLSGLLKTLYTFRPDSSGAALAADKGLFVVTVPADRAAWYAVTSQLSGSSEDRHVVPGGNALTLPVTETLALPRPVFQRALTLGGITADVYTLWTWPQDTPLFPAMSNRASWPYDCSVTHGIPQGPTFLRPHALGGDFTQMFQASGNAQEWVVSLDDYTLNGDLQTFWYGYHSGYDFTSNSNVAPASGPIVDYTNRRILHTFRWARRNFDLDTTRCYAFGYSLGGTYSLQLAFTHPELIAAAMGSTGKVDYSFQTDPNAAVAYNPGGQYRLSTARLWGTVANNLASSAGPPVYAELNDDSLAARYTQRGAVFHVNFSGKHDATVGWAEKIGFYEALQTYRQGGVEFWDTRDHAAFLFPGAMGPMLDLRYLYRFKSNLSWPAFSHCSRDNDPGNGTATSGDSLGTINGYMDWDPAVTDSANKWQITLKTRGLTTQWGPLAAPESLTVDVTPRRLQLFTAPAGTQVNWTATRLADAAVVQSGTETVDALGLVTVPAVKTYRTGTRLALGVQTSNLSAPPRLQPLGTLAFAPFANPVRGRALLAVTWPHAGTARVELYDTSGRRVRTLLAADVAAGEWHAAADLSALSPGVYLARATQAGASVMRRLVLLR